MPLPGDDLVPDATYRTTRAITIDAPAEDVWPWLVQLGAGRAGFYTYDRLERLAGAGIHNVDRVLPELQHLTVGDIVPLSALGGPTVVRLEPNRLLLLHDRMDARRGRSLPDGEPSPFAMRWTWAFVLRPGGAAATRLLVRTRASFAPHPAFTLLVPLVLEPVHFLMERGMLRGIMARAEQRGMAPAV